jgi:hypothetical protein
MDSLQFWIYIIIAVIYVISRAMKKANQDRQSSSGPSQDESSPGEFPKQLTFEELLREITESKQPKPQQPQPAPRRVPEKIRQAVPKPKPAYVDYDDDLEDEAKGLEDIDYESRRQEQAYDAYEQAKRDAFLRPSLEETLFKEKTDVSYSRFKEFSMRRRTSLLDEYVAELRKPSGFKKAIVLSEILNRRF